MDDTFVVWPHGEDNLHTFLQHLNNINKNIQFTIETEKNGRIPFLDVEVSRKDNMRLGHKVYRKPTHTDRYLQKSSNHHPRQKCGIIKTLTERAKRICEPMHLNQELDHLHEALRANGYNTKEIQRATHPRRAHSQDALNAETVSTAILPYIRNVTDRIGKLLKKHNIRTIYKPTKNLKQLLKSPKDKQDPLTTGGVYKIPCSCGQVYIGTTMRSVNTRIKEHNRHCRLGQTEKSAVAEHALQSGHDIQFGETRILSTTLQYHARLYREAIEIHKHGNNFNRKEESRRIHNAWVPALEKTKLKYTGHLPSPHQSDVSQDPHSSDNTSDQDYISRLRPRPKHHSAANL